MFHDGFMGMWFGWIFWIVLIVFVFSLIIRFANQNKRNQNVFPPETPLEILKKRLARGEISQEEFENIKKHL